MKKVISVGKPVGPYSPAIECSGAKFIYVSGQIGINLDSDITVQTKEVMNKIEQILTAANAYLSDIVKTTIYITDITEFNQVNNVYAAYFPSDPPTRATMQVAALPLNAKIMIEAVAIRD